MASASNLSSDRLPIVGPETAGTFDFEHGTIGDEEFLRIILAEIQLINPTFLEEIDRLSNRVLFKDLNDENAFDRKLNFLLGAVMSYALLDRQVHIDQLEAYINPPIAS